jgi:hypothetical protein
MKAGGYDVMHAACPIKDDRFLSSTCIGSITDDWHPVRRLSLKEINGKLPKTFNISHVLETIGRDGFPPEERLGLFPNTGCTVIKLTDGHGKDWRREFPGFTMLDRIARRGNDSVAQNVPEDWWFGRWACRAGLKIGVTSKLVIGHEGSYTYKSDSQFGAERDEPFMKVTGASKETA